MSERPDASARAFDPDASYPVILAGPSGAGKTSLRDRLLGRALAARFLFSVSMTTRAPREGEEEGSDYRFVDVERFETLAADGRMLEHAVVHGDLYGTPIANLDAAREAGRHLLLDIDVQGARQVREQVPDVVSIMVLPPSREEMLRRLQGRGTENDEQLRRRYVSAVSELEAVGEFDYVVINDVLDHVVEDVRAIIEAEEHSISRVGEGALKFANRLKGEIERQMQ
ncbi:MAG: guanylate kinase [Gemmatimonadota bacterium]